MTRASATPSTSFRRARNVRSPTCRSSRSAAGSLISAAVPSPPWPSRHHATIRQIALAWLLTSTPIILAIPGTGSLDHLAEIRRRRHPAHRRRPRRPRLTRRHPKLIGAQIRSGCLVTTFEDGDVSGRAEGIELLTKCSLVPVNAHRCRNEPASWRLSGGRGRCLGV
jgi:hypothetical protein